MRKINCRYCGGHRELSNGGLCKGCGMEAAEAHESRQPNRRCDCPLCGWGGHHNRITGSSKLYCVKCRCVFQGELVLDAKAETQFRSSALRSAIAAQNVQPKTKAVGRRIK